MADPPDSDVHSAYRQAGVNYAVLDAGKRSALAEALATSHWLAATGARAVEGSRGEPAFVLRFAGSTLAFVLETLGTKSIIAREYHELAGVNRFDHVAYDAVAAVLNDLICVGALPLVLNAYFATGSSAWYEQAERANALLTGWRRACDDAQCAWGGGESPSLVDLLAPEEIELAGSALGFVPPPASRCSASSLPQAMRSRCSPRAACTPMAPHSRGGSPDSCREGSSPSCPTVQPSARRCWPPASSTSRCCGSCSGIRGCRLTYLSHITGHGLLKLMRPQRELTYRIHSLPAVPPVLAFLAAQAGLDAAAAHSTLNMGAGFAVYCRPGGGARVVELAHELGLNALLAGAVEEGPRQVVLEPVGVTFAGDQLALAPERAR